MDTSRSSTATRNPCRMAHTAEQFVNVRRTPRSDVGEGELVEAERLERAGAAEEREGELPGDGLVVDGAELEQAGCAGAVETTRSGWTRGARRSATPPLPGALDPTAVPRPRERGEGESPGRGRTAE
jgi:hypothetical protein